MKEKKVDKWLVGRGAIFQFLVNFKKILHIFSISINIVSTGIKKLSKNYSRDKKGKKKKKLLPSPILFEIDTHFYNTIWTSPVSHFYPKRFWRDDLLNLNRKVEFFLRLRQSLKIDFCCFYKQLNYIPLCNQVDLKRYICHLGDQNIDKFLLLIWSIKIFFSKFDK